MTDAESRQEVNQLTREVAEAKALLWFLERTGGDWHPACSPSGACGEAEPGGSPCLSPRYNKDTLAELVFFYVKKVSK